tara:strand:- start:383 stop:895 length:513 start_codon:yes stop_codon:yes gene_type:complete
MAASVSTIVGGPANVKIASTEIGHTTGGVTATVTPQNRERIVDEYGSTAVAIIHTGDEVRITVPWSEWAQATLNEIYNPGSAADTGAGTPINFKGVGRSAGYIYTTQSMDITPFLSTDAAKTAEFFSTTPIGEVSMSFNNDDDRILEVEYAALIKTDETDGALIGKLNLS